MVDVSLVIGYASNTAGTDIVVCIAPSTSLQVMALSQTAQNLLSAMNTQQIRNVLLREDTYEQKQVSFSAKKISKTRLQKSQQTPGSKTKRTLNSYIIFRSKL